MRRTDHLVAAIVGHSGVGPDAVRAQLEKIVRSPGFEASDRNRRFLCYVVDEALRGNSGQIKAYAIATSVFDRGANFDPQLDSIVRIEAGRLRRSLDNYYLREGAQDPIRITVPKGSYVPAFELAEASPIVAASVPDLPQGRKDQRGPVIFVAPFEEEDDQSRFPHFTSGLVRQIIVGLTRFTELFVFGPGTTFGTGSQSDRERIRQDLGADFILTGGTSLSGQQFRMGVLLINTLSGQCLWGETFKRNAEPGEILELRDEISERVVRALAQPYGILFNKARETDGANPGSLTAYDWVVRFHIYWRTYDLAQFEPVRAGLEQVIATDPGYAEAFACLSQLYTNAARFRYDVSATVPDPMGRAIDLARKAVELAPNSSRGHHALGMARWFSGDTSSSLTALRSGLSLNPNDSEIMADLGLRMAMLAQWEDAVPLLEESYARNPAQRGIYRVGLALFHYAQGRYATALDEARKMNAPDVVYGHLVEAISAHKLGLREDAEDAEQRVLAIDPTYFDHVTEDLESVNLHKDLIRVVLDGLQVPSRTPLSAMAEDRALRG